MRCATVRDLLLTDYADGRLPLDRRQAVDAHCASCASCRAVAEAAARTAGDLRGAGRVEPPAYLWQRIAASVEERAAARSVRPAAVFDRLRAQFLRHKPAFAVSTLLTVILMGALAVRLPAYRSQRMVNAYLQEQALLYLSSNGSEAFEESLSLPSEREAFFF